MPHISEPFLLTGLPHTSKVKPSSVKASSAIWGKASSVCLGISNSSITSYSLLPTPRLLWTHSLPPNSTVTALQVFKSQEDSLTVVGFGVYERKKHFVKFIEIDDKNSGDAVDKPATSFPVPGEVSGIKFSASGERVYVILKNSCVQLYALPVEENNVKEIWSSKTKASRTLIHYSVIPPSGDGEGPEDGSVVLVSKREVGKKSMIEVRILALDSKGSYELITRDIEVSEEELKYGLALAYYEGNLYRYSSREKKIYVAPILNGGDPTTSIYSAIFSVPSDVSEESSSLISTPSLLAIGRNLFLSDGKSVLLIDTQYHTTISQKTINEPLTSILGYVESSSTVIGVSTFGSSASASNNSTQSVIGINVDSGKGTLLESLGKGIGEEEDPWRLGYSDIFIKKNYNLREYSNVIKDIIATAQDYAASILTGLSEYKDKSDIINFEHKAISFLKGKEWDEIDELTNESKEVFAYEDKDRDVDREFIFELVDLVFDNSDISDPSSSSTLKLYPDFVPQKLIIYLLTHPLFPTTELPGLLNVLSQYPRLLRQAIVTAPAVECFDLVEALSLADDEIFRDIVNRVLEEYGQEEIFESIKLKYGTGENKSKATLDVVNRLIKLDVGWQLIPCFVDVGGLFGWDYTVISDLYKSVTSQVEALVSSAEIMTLIDETLRKFDATVDAAEVGRRSKKALSKQRGLSTTSSTEKARKGPELISAEQREQERMRNLLRFGIDSGSPGDVTPLNPADAVLQKKKRAVREGNLISRKVPLYTVEKLVL
ncbi:Utp8p [Sugiyamaella lignohabitans]|uniref:Utp8p n=1 Tax=Sugiyamaella lignohabitans TaxID=796027 RepID=A0A167FWH0_9ASCO|nr:Utp8p [Sugiyamaella lignohabitans]ANB15789.1 Utp8p [Sugiyamaella lignohabitans]